MVRFPLEVEEDADCPLLERRCMTVCVSSFAAKSKAIVAIADKAVTYGVSAPIQTDTGIKKMIRVGDSGWYALIAGNPSFAVDVIEKTLTLILSHPQHRDCYKSAHSMMLCMGDAYKQCREALTETDILSPYFLTKKLWSERSSSLLPLNNKISTAVQTKLEKFSTKTSLLVFGFDSETPPKPHLFSIRDPGVASNHDVSGNHAVGIGAGTAIGRMAFWQVDRDDPLDEVLYEVFDAKANAELVQGVGYNWDAWVALPRLNPINVRLDIRALMDKVFNFETASPYVKAEFGKRELPPKTWKKRLMKYADELLERAKPHPKSVSQKSKSKR